MMLIRFFLFHFVFFSSFNAQAIDIKIFSADGKQGGGRVHHSVIKSFLDNETNQYILTNIDKPWDIKIHTDVILIGQGTQVARGVQLKSGSTIGENNIIGAGSKIGKVEIGNNNKIDMAVRIEDGSVIKDHIWLERGVIISSDNTIHTGSHLHAGVRIIGPGAEIFNKTEIGAGSEVYEQVKIGTANIIGHGSVFQKESSTGKSVQVGDCFEAKEKVSIGEFSILGDSVDVLKGVKVGSNTRVMHGSTVEKNLDNASSLGCDPVAVPYAVPVTSNE